jgi:recombination protein RecT
MPLADRIAENEQALATTEGRTVTELLRSIRPQLELALPRHIDPDRFLRMAITTVRTTPKLAECDPLSLLGAVMESAQRGLEIDSRGLAYLVPFGRECTFLIGYKGEIELARRSGVDVYAHAVYPGDHWHCEYGLDQKLEHVPSDDDFDEKDLTRVYAVGRDMEYPQLPPKFVVLTKAKVERYRSRSKAAKAQSSPWNTDYEAMALKTCVHRLADWLPQSPDLAAARAHDDHELKWSPDDGVEVADADTVAEPEGES